MQHHEECAEDNCDNNKYGYDDEIKDSDSVFQASELKFGLSSKNEKNEKSGEKIF